jgi:hypothetical protein
MFYSKAFSVRVSEGICVCGAEPLSKSVACNSSICQEQEIDCSLGLVIEPEFVIFPATRHNRRMVRRRFHRAVPALFR